MNMIGDRSKGDFFDNGVGKNDSRGFTYFTCRDNLQNNIGDDSPSPIHGNVYYKPTKKHHTNMYFNYFLICFLYKLVAVETVASFAQSKIKNVLYFLLSRTFLK